MAALPDAQSAPTARSSSTVCRLVRAEVEGVLAFAAPLRTRLLLGAMRELLQELVHS